MKKLAFLTLAVLGMVLASFTVVQPAMASVDADADEDQTILCRWSEQVHFCLTSAPDGYCAYGGPDCSTTYPVVTP
ncbi:hypothetical protein [Algoriphagus yeomjeoni]|uniref:Uncharacterized protein n=1 Tax=Algoriphagus yeomjeoni TaxID=291403 RepID=A0A327PSW4_9BACT|nr:hypothetical protein [Algoriphagus yeomjeoni]RAI95258.1 hypothetical protein LV83_00509 [Algoriphagus yeomjeoni]